MIRVTDSKIWNEEVWFKVELEKSTQVLAKELYTIEDVEHFKKEAIKNFIDKQVEKLLNSLD